MAKEALKKGLFITFEGIEGCGKSTHSRLLFEYLKSKGYHCVHTREPGGTKLGEMVRRILLNSDGVEISDLTELFLFEACRSQIVAEVIMPELKKKKIVICDRFSDATICYQGYGGKIKLKTIETLDRVASGSLKPDMTILLDIDTIEGLRRARKKGVDRMESKRLAYHRRVRAGYLKLAKSYPERIKIIKVDDEIKNVQSRIRNEAEMLLKRRSVS